MHFSSRILFNEKWYTTHRVQLKHLIVHRRRVNQTKTAVWANWKFSITVQGIRNILVCVRLNWRVPKVEDR